ncbi:aspartyl-phosphate phosphatase Spo0E family protein [Bacillus sp. USDA818B3_A]|uniref:aspartyl-phosphate phosphatase Spo0E family protein n=1 Tax=Bacillus sp. USDA818B3_A TaxID=2698834 RepID=UPI001369707E|nr:aspartyl-phosphate phosphatase Spo0E family protein [Bacillus sp. USDA818B3_A]
MFKDFTSGEKDNINLKEVGFLSVPFRGLQEEIEALRNHMVKLASDTSLSNHKVIEVSRKLDGLLNKYHSLLTR